MKKKLFLIFGYVSLLLGVAGVFLPLLPTTPFLLLTAWLWFRSSPGLYRALLSNRYLGSYIRDYERERYVPLRVKVVTLFLLWASMLYCIFFLLDGIPWAQAGLFLLAAGVSWHILSLGKGRRADKGRDEDGKKEAKHRSR